MTTQKKSFVLAKNTTAVVERNFKLNAIDADDVDGVLKDSQREDIISVQKFVTTPAEVEVGIALTMNLGDYESAKFSVHLRVPCYAEEKDQAVEFAQKWVEDRVRKEQKLVRMHMSGDINPL